MGKLGIWLGAVGAVVDAVRGRPSAAQRTAERRRALELVADDMEQRDGRSAAGCRPIGEQDGTGAR